MSENTFYTVDEAGDEGKSPRKAKDGGSPREETQLQKLRGIVSKKVERSIVLIPVPERPGVSLKVSPNISQSQMKSWRKSAGEDSRNGLDPTRFACLVIGHSTIGMFIEDDEVLDENGNNMTFAHPQILDMTDTTKPVPDAVRALFGVDPHVESAALAILDAAGYSDTVAAVDPTTESSTN